MSETTCVNCRWFAERSIYTGECRIHPPMIDMRDIAQHGYGNGACVMWPIVGKSHWCGDFKAREESK